LTFDFLILTFDSAVKKSSQESKKKYIFAADETQDFYISSLPEWNNGGLSCGNS
jgi:hypothetical protein